MNFTYFPSAVLIVVGGISSGALAELEVRIAPNGKIIRALSVGASDAPRSLSGPIGNTPRSALCFESRDHRSLENCHAINNGQLLAPVTMDVQAVTVVGEVQNPLLVATLRGDQHAVEALLRTGTDPNSHDSNRNTALIYAARDGRTKIVRILLDAGADPNWIDGERVTPLILAAYKGHVAIVKQLLLYKVDRKHRDQWGRSAMDCALRRGQRDPIVLLLRAP